MDLKKKNSFCLMLLLCTFFLSCTENICPDVCSESLNLKSNKKCECVCTGGASFTQLMVKWDNNRICITEFAENEDPYLLLSHQANYLTDGRSDYLLLYMNTGDLLPHPSIPNAEMGFFKFNFYGEFSRDLWSYTKYPDNDTLYTGFGLSPSVPNRSFLPNEPPFHSGKLYYSNNLLTMEKRIYDRQSDWENEINEVMSYELGFFALEKVN